MSDFHAHLEDVDHEHPAHRFPFFRFITVTLAQTALFLWLFSWLWPERFQMEMAQPGWIILTTFLFGLPMSLFEYLYHRYLLHSAVLPFLGTMHSCHVTHHGLTYVKAPVSKKEPEKMVEVDSEYPIVEEHQEESMMFPFFSVSVFYVLFLSLFGLPIFWLAPSVPIFSSIIFCVTLSYAGYEFWHALLHLPFERHWQPLYQHKRFGRMVQYIYSFHLMHHFRPTCNLAVVGFWGVALWDHVFRTHRRPVHMPLDGAKINYLDVELRKPVWPISQLDKWQGGLYRTSRKLEAWAAKVFLRRSATSK